MSLRTQNRSDSTLNPQIQCGRDTETLRPRNKIANHHVSAHTQSQRQQLAPTVPLRTPTRTIQEQAKDCKSPCICAHAITATTACTHSSTADPDANNSRTGQRLQITMYLRTRNRTDNSLHPQFHCGPRREQFKNRPKIANHHVSAHTQSQRQQLAPTDTVRPPPGTSRI